MNSVQESKQELEAAIRYAENAISSANKTIESMEFRQEMAKKQSFEKTGREAELERELQRQKDLGQGYYDNMMTLKEEREMLEKNVKYLRDENERLKVDKKRLTALEIQLRDKIRELKEGAPTMPVIPKAVAIAIFREGVAHGVCNACDEIDNSDAFEINESEYCGDFEVSFSKYIDLSEHLDLDWMRDKVGDYDEASVIEALKNLCADKEFECRIHGVDEQES